MTVLEKIKKTGGFADFGFIVSMPLGYFMDGTPAQTHEYNEVQKLIAAKELVKSGEIGNAAFNPYLTNRVITGNLLKCKE